MIGAGGTAGHVVPALAVADALRDAGHRVVFVGGDREALGLVAEEAMEVEGMHLPRGEAGGGDIHLQGVAVQRGTREAEDTGIVPGREEGEGGL